MTYMYTSDISVLYVHLYMHMRAVGSSISHGLYLECLNFHTSSSQLVLVLSPGFPVRVDNDFRLPVDGLGNDCNVKTLYFTVLQNHVIRK